MMRSAGSRVAAAAAMVVASIVLVSAHGAGAATTPPYEPDPQATGSLALYDSSGNVVTTGNIADPLAAYAVGSATVRAGDVQAVIYGASPNFQSYGPLTANFGTEQMTAYTNYPLTSGPANIQTLSQTHPTAAIGGATLQGFMNDYPNDPTHDSNAAYQNLYQIRLLTANSSNINATGYDELDVLVNGSTWTQVYPVVSGPTSTTTTLSASPASPQNFGTDVTLTATLTPSAAAGTVQFKDGTTDIGTPVTVSSGTASTATSTLSVATHSLTAVFTPTNSAAYSGSTSTAVSYTINSAAVSTTTTLGITPASPITAGTSSTLTATLNPTDAAGSVQFMDGATAINSPVAVSSGTATTSTTFSTATHSVTAVFTPTNAANFSASTSLAVSYIVNAQAATQTSTTLAVSLGSPQTYGQALSMTATVTPTGAVGSVQFLDGSTVIGTQPVSGGTASIAPTTLSAGMHNVSASFIPTNVNQFTGSQSSVSQISIAAASTTTSLSAAPVSTATAGDTVTLTATVAPATADGSVQFFDGTTQIGAAAPVASGTAATTTTTLPVGTDSLTATFVPGDGNYSTSTSTPAVSYTITQAVAGTTMTTLAVTPATSPVASGTPETLTATVTPTAAGGSIAFFDGTTPIGTSVTLISGSAMTTTTLPVGSHSLTAQFTPADPTSYDSSTSTATSYQVVQATTTTTTLAVAPASSAPFGSSVTMTATISPSAAPGSVVFYDGTKALGSSVAVSSGTAAMSTTTLPGGTHSLTAAFTPTSPIDYTTSTSTAQSLTVTALATTTALAVSPASPVNHGQKVTLTATLTPSGAAGSVSFLSGTTVLGSATVSGGHASYSTTSLPVGVASLSAKFNPSTSVDYAASTSSAQTLRVNAVAAITSVTSGGKSIANGGSVAPGATLSIIASGFTANSTVTVTLHSSPTVLGTTEASSSGGVDATVTLPVNVAAGVHTLTVSDGAHTATMTIHVTGSGAGGGSGSGTGTGSTSSGSGGLANTGLDVLGLTALGLTLLVGGLLITPRARRRHRGLHRFG